jgi:hypothetical protein
MFSDRYPYLSQLNAPIVWYTKKHNTVETNTFGSKFVALKIATEMLRGLQYKLHMLMGIPVVGLSCVYCDNRSVVINSSSPASMLKKKSNSIAYHCLCESMVAYEQWITYESTHTNLANLLTNSRYQAECTGTIWSISYRYSMTFIQDSLWD